MIPLGPSQSSAMLIIESAAEGLSCETKGQLAVAVVCSIKGFVLDVWHRQRQTIPCKAMNFGCSLPWCLPVALPLSGLG
jgi:hypothetical protein